MGPQWLYVTLLVLGMLSILCGVSDLKICAHTEDLEYNKLYILGGIFAIIVGLSNVVLGIIELLGY